MRKRDALRIFRAALEASDPRAAVLRHVHVDDQTLVAGRRRYRLAAFDNIFAAGAGKAGGAMAAAVESLLGRRLTAGLINVPDGVTAHLRRVELQPARHPLPDERGIEGARRIAEIARAAGPRDLVVCLISGGASALMPAPRPPLSLGEKQEVTRAMMNGGATIHELNAVRKHLSVLKGGQLAALAHPATVVTLILSDVIGDDLDVIGSGPTVGDRTTLAGARALLRKYRVRVPDRALEETPKPGDPRLSRVQNLIVGSNRLAMDAAAEKARELGYRVPPMQHGVAGESRAVAEAQSAAAMKIRRGKTCLLAGGETTVTVRGSGMGGRNQEFALAAAIALQGTRGITVLSAGTDGADGPTPAAGAIADGTTVARAAALGVDARQYLANNDSYHFFEPLGDLIETGPTGTNVMDVSMFLVE